MATAVFTSFLQLTNSSGTILNGGTVTVYQATTTTPISLFSNTGLSTPATNPITLDTAGRHSITYFSAQAYKVLIKDSGGSTVVTIDNIDPNVPLGTGVLAIANGGTGAASASAALAALGGATSAEVADVAADVAAIVGTLGSTEKTHIATGTTAQRPASPIEGDIRRNTTTVKYEGYDGTNWLNQATYTTSSAKPTVQRLTSGTGATYTTPAGCAYIKVRMVGAGGGGGAAATNAGAAGSADTSFSSGSPWTAVKGSGGAAGGTGTGGAGGTGGTDGTGTLINRIIGQSGGGGANSVSAGIGGSTPFAGAGMCSAATTTQTGVAAKANTGSGGSGGNNAGTGGGGGGAGEYVEFYVTAPAASYTYTIGTGGNGGSAGSQPGGNGAAGIIIVEEFYIS